MEFLLHEKNLWDITLGELLPPKVEFGEIVLEGSICFLRRTNWLMEQFF